MLFTYKDLIVWQKSIELVTAVYHVTKTLPADERYGLTSQMRRAAVSIPSNIAEGRMRGSDRSCKQFFLNAFASAGELDTQIHIVKRLPEFQHVDVASLESQLIEILRMLNKMIEQLSSNTALRT